MSSLFDMEGFDPRQIDMLKKLLIANRGEIAIRIAQGANELGLSTVGIHSADDAKASPYPRRQSVALDGRGAAAYLDIAGVIAAGRNAGADSVHPGYGFRRRMPFCRRLRGRRHRVRRPDRRAARAVRRQGTARAHAERPAGCRCSGHQDRRCWRRDGVLSPARQIGVALKAIAGGGGCGMRLVTAEADLADAFVRASAEAKSAFGNGALYVERLIRRARHIEVQIVGDGKGGIAALGERGVHPATAQPKIVELAPSPNLVPALRRKIVDAAIAMAKAASYRSLGTFEFLVEGGEFFFIEANPRLQVEHTVTEEVWGVDQQLLLAGGASLADTGILDAEPHGQAIQLRINMETMTPDGSAKPGGGAFTAFEPPSGRGVRVDTYGYAGYRTNPNFDSLLAKLIVHSPSTAFADVLARSERARLVQARRAPSNIGFLRALLAHSDVPAPTRSIRGSSTSMPAR